jgi:hypothetical protein
MSMIKTSSDASTISLTNTATLGRNLGVSESARIIQIEAYKVGTSLAQTITFGEQLLRLVEGLLQAESMYSEDNWDGYEAKGINGESRQNAFNFALSLPPKVPIPEIYVDPDGEVAFEWYEDKRKVFSISFGSKNKISYAGTYGSNKTYGVEYFCDDIPDVILRNIKRLYSE